MLKFITPHLSSSDRVNMDISRIQALNKAMTATKDDVYRDFACRDTAKVLVSVDKVDLASF